MTDENTKCSFSIFHAVICSLLFFACFGGGGGGGESHLFISVLLSVLLFLFLIPN